MSEEKPSNALDPFQRLQEAVAREARDKALERPHSTETWRYDKRPPLRFRASESGDCARRIWYRLMGCVPKPDSPDLVMKQVEGNVAQDVVRALFKKYGIPIEDITFAADGTQIETASAIKEFDVDGTTVKVSARSDGLFPETPHGPARFEFKTAAFYKFDWLQKTFNGYFKKLGRGLEAVIARLKEKNQYYIAQIQMTMAVFDDERTAFGIKGRSDVDYGLTDENGARTMVYVDADPDAQQGILRKFARIKEAVRAEEPPMPLLEGSMECSFCPFNYQCWGAVRSGKVTYPDA